MSELETIPTSASALVGTRVVDDAGASYGRVKEFAVDVAKDTMRVAGFVLKQRRGGKARTSLLPVEAIELRKTPNGVLHAKARPEEQPVLDDYLLLDRDLLDQQIIDVDGRKVVRVNDVNMVWEATAEGAVKGLLIQEVEVGTRGASRRLFKGLPIPVVEGISTRFSARVIPWEYVDLIDRDPARRVKLKIGQDRLAKLHPSDIAELLGELAPAEREAVFSSLPEETAAEALEEFEPEMQKELLERMDEERAADIIEEMDPGAAADLLNELPDEKTEAILEEMEPEERQDVEELLEFASDSAAGLMTNSFVSVPKEGTVADVIHELRKFEGDTDTITEVYLLGEDDKLAGVVTLPQLLLATPETRLAGMWEGHIVSCKLHDTERHVMELFDKYNLRALPVVDSQGSIIGVIHAEQVIGQLIQY